MKESTGQLIRRLVKEELEKFQLNEAFQSSKLRTVNTAMKASDKLTGNSDSKSWNAWASAFGVKVDQVTDNHVTVVNGQAARGLMKKNPNWVCFFVKSGIFLGALRNKKWLKVSGWKSALSYSNWNDIKGTPKHISNTNDKRSRGRVTQDGSTLYDKMGTAGWEARRGAGRAYHIVSRPNMKELLSSDVLAYCVDVDLVKGEMNTDGNLSKQQQDRLDNLKGVYMTMQQYRDRNKERYRKVLATSRLSKENEVEKVMGTLMKALHDEAEKAFKKIMKNAAAFKFDKPGVNKSFGKFGTRSYRSYTDTMMSKIIDTYDSYEDLIKLYARGKNWEGTSEHRNFQSNYKIAFKIVRAVNDKKLKIEIKEGKYINQEDVWAIWDKHNDYTRNSDYVEAGWSGNTYVFNIDSGTMGSKEYTNFKNFSKELNKFLKQNKIKYQDKGSQFRINFGK